MTTLVISPEDLDNFRRLDQYLHHHLPEISRSYIKTLFTEGNITSSEKIELKRMPPAGTTIEIDVPPPRPTKAQAEDIPLEVLFEDEHLIVINKPVGMVTHPAPGNYEGTLVNAILHHCGESLSGVGGEQRPGIVHRLDKGTSGVMVVAKTQASHEGLSQLFAEHDIERVYHCITVAKHFPLSVKVESSIGRHPQNRLKQAARVKNGRHAVTYFKKLETHGHFHLVECRLETGRTHQIRVHLSDVQRTPILFDPLYGNSQQDTLRLKKFLEIDEITVSKHPLLHAKVLGFVHPITKEKLRFETDLPKDFFSTLDLLREKSNEIESTQG